MADSRTCGAIPKEPRFAWRGRLRGKPSPANVAEARKNATDALKPSNTRDVEYGSAFALSLTHDGSKAQALANDLAKRFADDTLLKVTYLPLINALASLHRLQPAESVRCYRPAFLFSSQHRVQIFSDFWRSLPGVRARPRLSVIGQSR